MGYIQDAALARDIANIKFSNEEFYGAKKFALLTKCGADGDIASIKFSKEEFSGAQKYVIIDHILFPDMDGLSQMLPVLEVHMAAQSKVGRTEMDWYGILQVDPGANASDIKKQYKKLALALHPDKNKAVGAEAAFKLLAEARETLCDEEKRAQHDIKRNSFWTACPKSVKRSTSFQESKTQYQLPREYENERRRCPEDLFNFVKKMLY